MKKLKKAMIDKDMKIKDLAEKTGVSIGQISLILNQKSDGSLAWWRRAAEVLGVELSDILE